MDTSKGRIASINKTLVNRLGRLRELPAADLARLGNPDPASRFIVWDAELKGFGVRVSPAGTLTYVYRYRPGEGGRRAPLRLHVLGQHGKLTPDQARDLARDTAALVRTGKDPQAERAEKRGEPTLGEFCGVYLAAFEPKGALEGTKKASTLALDRIRIRRHIEPSTLVRCRLSEIRRADVARFMRDIEAGRIKDPTPWTRGGPGAAARSVGLLQGILGFAVASGYIASNPAKGIKRPRDGRRERFLSADELTRLGASLNVEEANGNEQFAAVIRLLLLTGMRKNEAVGLRWSEVDLAASRLELADSKTGAKRVTLGAAAVEILSGIAPSDSPFVFPDPADPRQPLRNVDWSWVRTRNRADLADVRIHDLRHGFASVGVMGGLSLPLLGKLLGHADPKSTARYAHIGTDPLRDAADRIAAQISGALTGTAGEVVPFGRARA